MEYWNENLLTAARIGDIEILKLCLQNGADIDFQDVRELTALMMAAFYGQLEASLLIIDSGCKTDITDTDGQTALMKAAREGHLRVTRLLLVIGCKTDIRDVLGETALIKAAYRGRMEVTLLLLDRGCNKDITDNNGMTALMWSAAGGQLEITRLLLNSGCKPDITDKGGETALHWAARRGYLQTTICLVEQGGASPLVKTHEGRTPYDLAADMKKGNYKEVMEYLQVISYPMLTKLGQLNRKDFQELVALGTFASYENMVYLAGPCNIGKSSLASILICEEIPKTWLSTDGLIIHFGRNGIDLQQRKMIPLKKGSVDVLSKLLLGNPEFKKQPSLPGESQEEMSGDPNSEVTTKANSPKTSLYPSNQEHLSPKSHQETPKDFQEPPMYNARSIQDNLLEKIIKGTNIMRIAPSDLVDFGGQKSFDMTHQLFIQHRGTFILMFDGRKGLDTELEEYPQGDVTAASVLEHWINSVLTYCNKTEDEMPRIVFAATHSDSFSEDEKKILALKFSEELRDFFFYTQPS